MTELPNSTYADYNVGPLYTADQVRQYAAAENAALRERIKVLADALQRIAYYRTPGRTSKLVEVLESMAIAALEATND